MFDTKKICDVVEKFFLCTHIPTKAIAVDGKLLHSAGYEKESEDLFRNNNLFKIIKSELEKKEELSYITVNCPNNIKFTANYICIKHKDKGFFIIGPYTSEFLKNDAPIYKPSCCIPHIVSLLENIGGDQLLPKVAESKDDSRYSSFVRNAINYINNNYERPITLQEVVNYISINKSYFCTLFKKETGKTYSQYLNEFRVSKSKQLLQDRSLSILDIALSVGFNNQNYFNMTFKKLTNKTPLEFRNSIYS